MAFKRLLNTPFKNRTLTFDKRLLNLPLSVSPIVNPVVRRPLSIGIRTFLRQFRNFLNVGRVAN